MPFDVRSDQKWMTAAFPVNDNAGARCSTWVLAATRFSILAIGVAPATPRKVDTVRSALTELDNRNVAGAPTSAAVSDRQKIKVRTLLSVTLRNAVQPVGTVVTVVFGLLTVTKANATSPAWALAGMVAVKVLFDSEVVVVPIGVMGSPPLPTTTFWVRDAVCPALSVTVRVTSWVRLFWRNRDVVWPPAVAPLPKSQEYELIEPLSRLADASKLQVVPAQSTTNKGSGAGLPPLPTPANTAKCGTKTPDCSPAMPVGLKMFRKSPPTIRPDGPELSSQTPSVESALGFQGRIAPSLELRANSFSRRIALALLGFSPRPFCGKFGLTEPSRLRRGSWKSHWP